MLELADARTALADEWREFNPTSPSEILEFYRVALGQVDDLEAWHKDATRQQWTAAVVATASACHARSVIDVGAGVGHDLAALRMALPNVSLVAVEPNYRQQDIIEATIPDVIIIENLAQLKAGTKVDMISCIDVLEHVPNPDALLTQIIDLLGIGGFFVEATATHDHGTPLHLDSLRGYTPGAKLDAYGFVVESQLGRLRVWRRVALQRDESFSLLLCAYRSIGIQTQLAVNQLIDSGWRYNVHMNDALIDRVRAIAVTNWLRNSAADVFLMIDDDIIFNIADATKVAELARSTRSIACAAYPVHGGSHFACRLLESNIMFGPTCEPIKIKYAGTGFMAVHRDVINAIVKHDNMPLCHDDDPNLTMYPLFTPAPIQFDDGWQYLSEDWAFCQRAENAGFDIWLDPSVIIGHMGVHMDTVYNMRDATPSDVAPTEVKGG